MTFVDRAQKLEILATGSAAHDVIQDLYAPTRRESVLCQLQQLLRRDAVDAIRNGPPREY
jgi:hypothetical protein